MSLDFLALSHVRRVDCPGGDECHERHCRVGSFRRGDDVVRAGCYVISRGGRAFRYRVGTYLVYNLWRRQLSLLALGVEPEEVWDHARRYRGRPFVELIDCPDGGQFLIGPKTAAKLVRDFATFAPEVESHARQHAPGINVAPRAWFRGRKQGKHWLNRSSMLLEREVMGGLGATIAAGPPDYLGWMVDTYLGIATALRVASRQGFVVLA